MSDGLAVELRQVVKRFGEVTAVESVSLQIQHGEFFSLLGPSGCGKTTTLRLIAGFETPTSGDIIIDGEMQGHLPPYQRPVNTVFQNYALFPHMTVAQNVAFGLEMKKVSKDEIRRRVGEALELVHLGKMGSRRPKQLSGGQQQRVALARALVNRPQVLLLDEPLGALDLKLRKAMQGELKALQEQVGITFIYVTHDQEEALTMSDRIAVMSAGHVFQVGLPEDIYENPNTRFVADFIGETNFIPGTVHRRGPLVEIAIAETVILPARWASEELPGGSSATLSIRPEKILIASGDEKPPSDGEFVSVPGQVEEVVYLGTDTRYIVRIVDGVQIVVRVQNLEMGNKRFKIGDAVMLHWRVEHGRILKE